MIVIKRDSYLTKEDGFQLCRILDQKLIAITSDAFTLTLEFEDGSKIKADGEGPFRTALEVEYTCGPGASIAPGESS